MLIPPWFKAVDVIDEIWRRRSCRYLLTGFSGAGKTELRFALKDDAKRMKHDTHSEEATTDSNVEEKIGRIFLIGRKTIIDGGGSLNHSKLRKPYICKFLKKACSSWSGQHEVLHLVNLEKLSDVNKRRHAKSEINFLNGLVKEVFKGERSPKRIKMRIIGTHLDCVTDKRKASEDLTSVVNWIDDDCFDVINCIPADLRHDESVVKKIFSVK